MAPCTEGQPPVLLMLLLLLPPSGSAIPGPSSDGTEPAVQMLTERREGPLSSIPPPSYTNTAPGASGLGGSSTRRLLGSSQTFSYPNLRDARADRETVGASRRTGERMLNSAGAAEPLARKDGAKTEGPTSAGGGVSQYTPSEIERTTVVSASNPARGTGHHLSQIMDLSAPWSTQASVTPGPAHSPLAQEARRRGAQTHVLSRPGRPEAQTHTPSQPERHEAHSHILIKPEMTEAQTHITSQSVRLGAQTRSTSEPEMAEAQTHIPYEPGRREAHTHITKAQASTPSELTRPGAHSHISSEPEGAEAEIHVPSDPTSMETRILLGSEMAKVLVPSESRRSEAPTPSQSWRPEAGQTETHIPSELAEPETQTLPEPSRAGGGSQGRLIHARSPRNKIAGYHTFQEQDASAVQTQGTETPPAPGGTRSALEWKGVLALNRSERIVIETRALGGTRSFLDLDALGPGTARPAETLSEEPRDPDLSEPLETRGETSSEPGMRTLVTLPEPRGGRTRTLPQPDEINGGTTFGTWEAKPHSPPEPGGAATQTLRGPEPGQTAAEADRNSAWTSAQASRGPRPSWIRDPFPSGSYPDSTESHSSMKAWTGPVGALEQDWTGVLEQKEAEPVSVSEPETESDQESASSSDADKSTSLSHTDSMYISTTYNRGGERTLLSITNGSMSVDITERSVYYNISKTSDPPDSSSVEDAGSSRALKGDTHFTIASWERFLAQNSKTLAHSSQTYDSPSETWEPIDNLQNTTNSGTNTGDPSVDSSATTSRSDYGSTVLLPSTSSSSLDSFDSSLNASLSSASPSSLPPESFSSILSESFSSSHSEVSTSFMLSESSTGALIASPSTAERPFFPSPPFPTSSIPVISLVPVVSLSPSPIPSSFSEVSSYVPTTSLLLSWPSQRPSLTSFSTSSTPSSWSSSPSSSMPSGSLSAESFETSYSPAARQDPEDSVSAGTSTALDHLSLLTDSVSHSDPFQTDDHTSMSSTMPSAPSEFATERFNSSLSKTDGTSRTESFTDASITWEDGTSGKTTAFLATKTSSSQGAHHFQTTKQATSITPDLTTLSDQFTISQLTTNKTIQIVSTTTESLRAEVTTQYSVLFRTSATETDHTSSMHEIPGMSTTDMGVSSTASIKITEQNLVASVSHKTLSPVKTTAMPSVTTSSTLTPPVSSKKAVRTFIGQIKISSSFINSSDGKRLDSREIEGEIIQMFNRSLSVLDGYNKSSILDSREPNNVVLSVQHIFSIDSNVTIYDVMRSLQSYIKSCEASDKTAKHCRLILRHQMFYKAGSLCNLKYPECDKETSECTDFDGIAICQCRTGYFKYSKMDFSCRACEDGYKRENGTCIRCPFGLGGFNCGNPYQLITIVIAAAGGGLLLILGTALIVTCCRKNKNDISKLIFKSGDFQMSPYAEYPKNSRSSEWGREAIEMQENGSTKNLLQVTDVYYSPGLRNAEPERNGLYPYSGVPGSRHSCIYPGQYNPTFLNEESRRRDYF